MAANWRQLEGQYLDRAVDAAWSAGNNAGNGYAPYLTDETPAFTTASGIDVYEAGDDLFAVGYDGARSPASAWAVDIELDGDE